MATKRRGRGWSQRGGRRSRAAVGSKGTAEQSGAGTRVPPGIPGRVGCAKTAALKAVAGAAESPCVLSSDPGKGGTQVPVIFPCRCSAPVALPFAVCCFPWHWKRALNVCFAFALLGCAKPKASPSMCA